MNGIVRILLFLILAVVVVITSRVFRGVQKLTVPYSGKSAGTAEPVIEEDAREDVEESARVGEQLMYDVKMGSLRLGTTVFSRLPSEVVDGSRLQVMTFATNLARFKDTERIYSDPQTFLPVRVERDIQNWLTKEKITEHYDQKNFTLTVVKSRGKEEEKLVIEKDGVIQHPVLLPHYVRELPDLKVGQRFRVSLPKREFTIAVMSLEDVTVPAGTFKAYRLESSPRQIAIWISADERRLPLKIQGVGVLNYVLVLSQYKEPALAYDSRKLCIEDRCFSVQVADTPEKKSQGLMYRDKFSEEQGMLFVYDAPGYYHFWMKNMRMPLDIVWISDRYKIVEIMRDVPVCEEGQGCAPFAAQQPAQYILELSAGAVSALRLEVGDQVML